MKFSIKGFFIKFEHVENWTLNIPFIETFKISTGKQYLIIQLFDKNRKEVCKVQVDTKLPTWQT